MTIENATDQDQSIQVPPYLMTAATDMLNIQDELNVLFISDDWKFVAADREKVDYGNAILEEATELVKCDGSWKWWKSKFPAPDLSNMKIELVDLLHFVMSDALSVGTWVSNENGTPYSELEFPDLNEVALRMVEGYMDAYDLTPEDFITTDPEETGSLLVEREAYQANKVRRAVHALLANALASADYYEGTVSGLDDDSGEEEAALGALNGDPLGPFSPLRTGFSDWRSFWSIALSAGFSFEDVYSVYLGKALLNHFRIANGDKAGVYHRNWFDGREDNDHLMDFIRKYGEDNGGAAPSRAITVEFLTSTYAAYKGSLVVVEDTAETE